MRKANYFMIFTFAMSFIAMLELMNTSDSDAQSKCDKGVSESEAALWEAFENPGDKLFQYEYLFKLWDFNWEEFGGDSRANKLDIELPYAKVLNAAFLLREGLSDDAYQWHSSTDYKNAGQAIGSDIHDRYDYSPKDTEEWLAFAKRYTQEVYLGCLLFNVGSKWSNPATRSGDFIHEGFHMWEKKYEHHFGHYPPEPDGSCEMSGVACDRYWRHDLSDFEDGDMGKWGLVEETGRYRFHSANQAQVEFLCDLAEFPSEFVPKSVREIAKAEANQRLNSRFNNFVAYQCGWTRPW